MKKKMKLAVLGGGLTASLAALGAGAMAVSATSGEVWRM